MVDDMDILEHGEKFNEIIRKYNFDSPEKAEEISDFLTDNKNHDNVSAEEFAKLFAIEEEEAIIFLSFIKKGIEFKETQKKFASGSNT